MGSRPREFAGRRPACGVLDGLLVAVRAEQSRVLVVHGEPGVGKTALLEYLTGQAAGCRVLRAVGVQSEGWTGPSERGIAIHAVSSFGSATNTALFDRLRSQVQNGILTLRVADVLPAAMAAEAQRRLAAGGLRGRLVLDFSQPL